MWFKFGISKNTPFKSKFLRFKSIISNNLPPNLNIRTIPKTLPLNLQIFGVHEIIIIIGDLSETWRRPTCLIWDQSETDMPLRRPIGYLAPSVSDGACRSPKGLWPGMSISNGSPIRHIGLRWVSDSNNIFVNSNLCGLNL